MSDGGVLIKTGNDSRFTSEDSSPYLAVKQQGEDIEHLYRENGLIINGYPDLSVGSVDFVRLPEEIAQCWTRGFKQLVFPARRCGNRVFRARPPTARTWPALRIADHPKADGGLLRVEVDVAEPPWRGQVQSLRKRECCTSP